MVSEEHDLSLEPMGSSSMKEHSSRNAVTVKQRSWQGFLLAVAIYLLLAVLIWWHVWTDHPSATTICGCGDPSLFNWFIAWPAYAVSHGLNPLYSTAMFHPAGVNLLDNTSEIAFGLLLAPVTWIFGSVTTLNVSLTLTPVLSALAMFALLRRWVAWTPAAFVGGLVYGFSPLAIVDLTPAHLMIAMLAIPPLIVICLDELLIRQGPRPIMMGVALGVLLSIQFFVSTEMLLIIVLASTMGIVLVVGYGLLRRRQIARKHARYAAIGIGVALATSLLLLAYPVWFALDGPGHISGPIWGEFSFSLSGFFHANLDGLFTTHPPDVGQYGISQFRSNHVLGGYQGPILSDEFFGWGVLSVLVFGLVVWHRERRLWLFGILAIALTLLALGTSTGTWTLWRLFVRLPLFEDVIPERILAMTWLCVAIMLGLVIDNARASLDQRRRAGVGGDMRSRMGGWLSRCPAWTATLAALLLAAIAIAAPARYLAQGLPLTTESVDVPTWFMQVAPRLSENQVLLVLPSPFTRRSPMTWQAVDGMSFSMVGGGGPSALLSRAGPEKAGQKVINEISYSTNPYLTITPKDVENVRQALSDWGVTKIVLPDQANLPKYDEVQFAPLTSAVITEATGELPSYEASGWVWNTTALPPARPKDWKQTLACILHLSEQGVGAVNTATRCAYS